MPELPSELRVDASYRNTNNWQDAHDVFNKFFRFNGVGINNTSGFRPKSKAHSSTDILKCAFCVLVTNFGESEWPDSVDRENGIFTYFGDNRSAGRPFTRPQSEAIGSSRRSSHQHTPVIATEFLLSCASRNTRMKPARKCAFSVWRVPELRACQAFRTSWRSGVCRTICGFRITAPSSQS